MSIGYHTLDDKAIMGIDNPPLNGKARMGIKV